MHPKTIADYADPLTGRRCVIRVGGTPGCLCGYVDLPEADLDKVTPFGGWTGLYDGLPGRDNAHGSSVSWGPDGAFVGPEWGVEWVRGELARLCAEHHAALSPWQYTDFANDLGASVCLREGTAAIALITVQRGGRKPKIEAWANVGCKVKLVKKPESVRAAAAGLLELGQPPIPDHLLKRLEQIA